ncbi:alpha/beta fold hydrolase [Streptomyces diastatochromogenes]|uniref:Hydrolase n=1 Tax=Streptomyces diastatochromogenes TaxID=42236 RepID=A0A233SY68_STRDA|nr:alpha/beta hydrolase [Streptomyces diastatochromogenes]MCZ0991683.1 alpha/beta hydrolase [Streptomyces diastatochromogenes]OXZ00593.1 hydrolase [Streptomyces diastatochromogenes]
MERTIQKKLAVGGDSWVTVDVYGEPDAPGLVVVPGVMSDAHTWRRVAGAIAAWPSVIVVNRRGRASSGPLTDSYSLRTEVEDLGVVLDEFDNARALFGWSYGGLITLLTANDRPIPQVIAYEPVMQPFGRHALPDLKSAAETTDWDRCVEIVNRQISGFSAAHVEDLRADQHGWAVLRRLSGPLYAELDALNTAPPLDVMARQADQVDLIIGQCNRGAAPYGTSFDNVRQHVAHARIHELPGQGHLAHIQAPAGLGHLLNNLAAT